MSCPACGSLFCYLVRVLSWPWRSGLLFDFDFGFDFGFDFDFDFDFTNNPLVSPIRTYVAVPCASESYCASARLSVLISSSHYSSTHGSTIKLVGRLYALGRRQWDPGRVLEAAGSDGLGGVVPVYMIR